MITVISVPRGLRFATTALFLTIPLIAFEVIIFTRAPWWRLPLRNLGYWSLAYGLICVPLVSWILNAKRWAYSITAFFAMIWILVSAWMAFRMRYPALGFFVILLLGFFFMILPWLSYEMKRSYFDPQLAWYQGLPKSIPALKCKLVYAEKVIEMQVSRIDSDGAFLFVAGGGEKVLLLFAHFLEHRKFDVVFNFRDRQIKCEGAPILSIENGIGAGIKFIKMSADLKKEIGDFVEILRGEGYV